MQVRDWVTEYFGTPADSLLDESVYSAEELKKDKIRLEQERRKIQKEMEEQKQKYKNLLRKGAEADEMDRQQYAQQAKFAKKKFTIKKKQYQKNSVVLGTVISVEGARELREMGDGETTEIESLIHERDVDVESVQEDMMNQMAEHELDMEIMQEVQNGLDVDILSADMEMEGSEELELMEEMAAGDISAEQVEIEEDEGATSDIDPSLEADIDMDEEIEIDEEI